MRTKERHIPAHGVDVRISEHLIALFAHTIESRELGLVVDSHATQADEASLMQVTSVDDRVLVDGDDGEHEDQESDFNDGGTHDDSGDRVLSESSVRWTDSHTSSFYTSLILF